MKDTYSSYVFFFLSLSRRIELSVIRGTTRETKVEKETIETGGNVRKIFSATSRRELQPRPDTMEEKSRIDDCGRPACWQGSLIL